MLVLYVSSNSAASAEMAVSLAQRQLALIQAQSRIQVAPVEAASEVGDRPDDRNGDAGAAAVRPATAPGTGLGLDTYA